MLHIVLICLAYIVGIIWGLYLSLNLGIVFFCLNLCIYFIFKKNLFKKAVIITILIVFLFGMFYSYYRFENYQNKYSVEEISTTIKVLSHDKTTEYYSTLGKKSFHM